MKKMTALLTAVALLAACNVQAQSSNAGGSASRGAGAKAGSTMASDTFAWGACIGSLALLGTIVGLTVSAASSSPTTFSH